MVPDLVRDPNDNSTLDMGMTTLIGYARVSTPDQNLNMQTEALEAAGCHKVFTDVASGARTERPGLDAMMEFLRPGDTLVVWKIDRLGRSMTHLVQTVDYLREKGVAFKSLNDPGIDTDTPTGKLMFGFFALLADFERALIRERTKSGLAAAKARGVTGGRRTVMTKAKLTRAKALISQGLSVREAAATIQVGKTALYNALRKETTP